MRIRGPRVGVKMVLFWILTVVIIQFISWASVAFTWPAQISAQFFCQLALPSYIVRFRCTHISHIFQTGHIMGIGKRKCHWWYFGNICFIGFSFKSTLLKDMDHGWWGEILIPIHQRDWDPRKTRIFFSEKWTKWCYVFLHTWIFDVSIWVCD